MCVRRVKVRKRQTDTEREREQRRISFKYFSLNYFYRDFVIENRPNMKCVHICVCVLCE